DRPRANHEDPPPRHGLRRPQDARQRLDPHAVELTERVRQRNAVRCAEQLREATGRDPLLAKLAARRLVAGEAARARAAWHAVHDRDAVAVLEHARNLVSQYGAARRPAE